MTKIQVHLRDTVTGISGTLEMDWGRDTDGVRYQYSDGNYGCDCNRSCFLSQANPAFDDVDDDIECNSGPNRIAIDSITDEQGEKVYGDDWR